MKKKCMYLFIDLSLLLWLVETFTGSLSSLLPTQIYKGLWGMAFMIFVVFPLGIEWLKGEHHECD